MLLTKRESENLKAFIVSLEACLSIVLEVLVIEINKKITEI